MMVPLSQGFFRPFLREVPAPFVTRWHSRTVANGGCAGLTTKLEPAVRERLHR
jgi:hypothetical protein